METDSIVFLKVKSAKSLGVCKSLDLQVDHPDHNFWAEGLISSNSHSVSYASLSALTVYLKFNYPQYFFWALLKQVNDESKPLEEITKINSELRSFGIKLLPPSLLKSDINFALEGRDIRFGLSSIKGVSTKVIEGLLKFRQPYMNKLQMFNAAKDCGINIGVLCSLIYCGCLDEMLFGKSRAYLALEAQLWNIMSEKEKKHAFEHAESLNYDVRLTLNHLRKTLDAKGAPLVKESRVETITKKYQPHKEIYDQNKKYHRLSSFWFERMLIGYSYSTNLHEIFKDESAVHDLRTVQECLDEDDGLFEFAGVVEEEKSWSSKKGNKCMKLRISDGIASLECIISNNQSEDKLQKIKDANWGKLPDENDIVFCQVVKKKGSFFVNKILIQNVKIFTKYLDLRKHRSAEKENKTLTTE